MNFQKSSVSAWNTSSQTLTTNEALNLADSKKTGCSIKFSSGSSSITLLKPGLYYISVTASALESGTAGDITIQLTKNGKPVTGALSSANSATTTDLVNLSFGKLIGVGSGCPFNADTTTLRILNTGVGATFSNVNVNIFKLA